MRVCAPTTQRGTRELTVLHGLHLCIFFYFSFFLENRNAYGNKCKTKKRNKNTLVCARKRKSISSFFSFACLFRHVMIIVVIMGITSGHSSDNIIYTMISFVVAAVMIIITVISSLSSSLSLLLLLLIIVIIIINIIISLIIIFIIILLVTSLL